MSIKYYAYEQNAIYTCFLQSLPLSVVWIKYILISILGWQHEKSRNKVIAFTHDMLSANSGLYRIAKSDISNISNIVIKMSLIYRNYTSETRELYNTNKLVTFWYLLELTTFKNNTTFLARCFNVWIDTFKHLLYF